MGKIGVILVVLKSFGGVDVMTCHDYSAISDVGLNDLGGQAGPIGDSSS
jgi:hypothetical protein